MTVEPGRQIPLGLAHQAEFGRDSFIVGDANRGALALIERWPDWPQPVVLLTGPQGSGKTHLARIWATMAGAPLIAARDLEAGGATDLVMQGAAAVEDIDRDSLDENALFHLLNTAREGKASLLLTSRRSPAHLPLRLADLRSRLRLASPAALYPPDETLLRLVLVKLFTDRQLTVEKPVVDFLLARMERSFAAAVHIVDVLDHEALASSAAVTRPLAAKVLAVVENDARRFTEIE